jgi:hypothetical protein
MHLTSVVTQRTRPKQLSASETVIKIKGGHDAERDAASPSREALNGADRSVSMPLFPAVGSSLLQLATSSVSQSRHASKSEQHGYALLQTGTSFAAAAEAHMLAYVVLFGIFMVMMGFGMLVIVGMKKEEEMQYQNPHKTILEHHARAHAAPPVGTLPTPLSQAGGHPPDTGSHLSDASFGSDKHLRANRQPGQQPRQGGSPGQSGARLQSMQGNPIQASAISSHSPPNSHQLCPDLAGAVVPDKSKFPMKIPMLLHANAEDQEHALVRQVKAKDGTPMFHLKITRHSSPVPGDTSHPEEYITLSLPEEDTHELVLCAFGRPQGKLECHIYQLGKDPWGIIREDGDQTFTVYLRAAAHPAFTATVQGTDSQRRVRITDAQHQDLDIAVANARTEGGPSNEYYEVECYPNCDIILTIIMLAGVDRLSVNAHK